MPEPTLPSLHNDFGTSQSSTAAAAGFSIVIPCFNEAGAILPTIDLIEEALGEDADYEVLCVDDGSNDGTREVLQTRCTADARTRLVAHATNRGYGAALKTGIRAAGHEVIVITDADGTYPVERIAELVAAIQNQDMVVGARIGPDVVYPLIRRIPKAFLRAYASWLAGQSIPDINSGLRVFRRSTIQRFMRILPDGFSFTTTITIAMLTNDYRVQYLPIAYRRRVGQSKIRPIRDTLGFMQLILRTGMYFAPLRVFMPVAGALMLGFLASLAYDIFWLDDLTEKSLMLLLAATNTAMFALLADMLDKRSN